MRKRHVATVFEAVNNDRKEIYISWTFLPISRAMADMKKRRPATISHWRPARESITLRSLAFESSEVHARAYIVRHLAKPLPKGWKYVRIWPEDK